MSQVDELSTAGGQSVIGKILGRHGRAAVGKGGVQRIIVEEIVCEEIAECGVLVNAYAGFVVTERLSKLGRGVEISRVIRLGNKLEIQHGCGYRRKCGGRNHAIRENTIGRTRAV